jgi:hypothetical protein
MAGRRANEAKFAGRNCTKGSDMRAPRGWREPSPGCRVCGLSEYFERASLPSAPNGRAIVPREGEISFSYFKDKDLIIRLSLCPKTGDKAAEP